MRALLLLLLVSAYSAGAQSPGAPGPWQMEQSGSTASLRGVHAVGGGVVWASGTGGTVLRSEDSGFEWQSCAMPPGAEKLDFRGIWAWDANTAMVMSSGPGQESRLYKTTDGCAHWMEIARNSNPNGFWDGLVFSDRSNGFLLGDPENGELLVEQTTDGGAHWTRIHAKGLNVGARGAFAASNSSLALAGGVLGTPHGTIHVPWIGTGGPGGAIVLQGGLECGMELAHAHPYSCLKHWDFMQTHPPLPGSSPSQGVFSLAVRTSRSKGIATGIAVGGDYTKPDDRTGTAAWTSDGGGHWTASTTPPGGYRSSVAYDADLKAWITVGPNGSDISRDDGHTWQTIEHVQTKGPKSDEWNALSLPWVVGPDGRIAKLNPAMLPTEAALPASEQPKVTSR